MAVELYDEHEQGERVRKWIREYGYSIVIGLVLAFAGIFGFRQWQDYQLGQQALAADYFGQIQRELDAGQLDMAEQRFEALRDEAGRSAYVGLAKLLLAAGHIEEGNLEPAARLYRELLENRRLSALWPSTRLRLARVLEAQGDIPAAIAVLDGGAPVGFEGPWAELRGDLYFARGDLDQARLAYQEALDNLIGSGGNEFLLQLKLDATGPASDGDPS